MMYNFSCFSHITDLSDCDCIVIPINWCASKYFDFSFKGFGDVTLIDEDSNLNNAFSIIRKSLLHFVELYKKEYVFSDPQLHYKPTDKTFTLKIGVMKMDHYLKLKDKYLADN